jgi:hypothetical protein
MRYNKVFLEERAMAKDLQDAERQFNEAGLKVRRPQPDSLHVSRGWTLVGDGIKLAHDVCGIIGTGDGQYSASFPTIGHVRLEVPGTLEELVPLVLEVYQRHEGMEAPFYEAVREVVLKSSDWTQPPVPARA